MTYGKHFILAVIGCMAPLAGHAAFAADSVVRCDFSEGIPATFTLLDKDGHTPSPDIAAYGFAVGTPWVAAYIREEDNYVAASTSWYDQSGTSDDWMILPPIAVGEGGATLSWRARASDKRFPDGYAVYVATGEGGETGGSTGGFDTAHPLFQTQGENAAWTRHSVSLDGYRGKSVRIAFVNNSTDRALLFIDDIFAGKPQEVALALDMPHVNGSHRTVAIRGQVATDAEEGIEGITLAWTDGTRSGTAACDTARARPGQPYSFCLDTGDTIPEGQARQYTVTATHGRHAAQAGAEVRAVRQRMVGEELTGNWCTWCVKGIVMTDSMVQRYGDRFIPVAVHGRDFLECPGYLATVQHVAGTTSYPACVVNRSGSLGSDVGQMPQMCRDIMESDTKGSIDLALERSGSAYEATARITVNRGGAWRIGFCLTEDDVYEPGDSRYYQGNAYAGGEYGEMGGYENRPRYITDFHFRHVARSYEETACDLPDSLEAGVEYDAHATIELPGSVLHEANVTVVAMLIDARDGTVANAATAALPAADGIEDLHGGNDTRDTCGSRTEAARYYTLDGRAASPHSTARGLYIVSDGTKYSKVVVR